MTANIEQIQNGVINFIEKEIASKAVGLKKFGVYFFMPIIKTKVAGYLLNAKELMPELFDENNNVNVDKVYNMAKEAIKKSGQFEYLGIIFNETDVDKLYSYIRQTAI